MKEIVFRARCKMTTGFIAGFLSMIVVNVAGQVPIFNSNPSAAATIFLDFDGHTVENTAWNYNGPIVCGESGLTVPKITEIFGRVSEDYYPFNVNVTTDSTVFLSAPITQRMRVIVTISSAWYGSAGGVAFVGSFIWGDDTPCFVFSQLLNYNAKYIAEAIAHEAGHTLGLYHQSKYDSSCVKISDYNYGQGTGEIGWAPIMGVGYYQNLTQWHVGPNSYGCNTIQNDIAVITNTTNGFGFRPDDYQGSFAQASIIPIQSNGFLKTGFVESPGDSDMFKIVFGSVSHIIINIIPGNVGSPNIGSDNDLEVALYNGSQQLLNIYNPSSTLSSIIDTTLNAGTFYLKVSSHGNIYSSGVGSMGSYILTGAILNNTLPLRRLELTAGLVNNKPYLTWIINADEEVVEQHIQAAVLPANAFTDIAGADQRSREAILVSPAFDIPVLYRVKVLFSNGSTRYSNVVKITCKDPAKLPYKFSNPVNDKIYLQSESSGEYSLFDNTGRHISKGNLSIGANSIPIGNAAPGIYLLQLKYSEVVFMEKILKAGK